MEEQSMSNPFFKQSGFDDVPVGSMIFFTGARDPSKDNEARALESRGWMVCDGRLLTAHDYPELFSVLRYVYGGEDNQFRLPDYRQEPLHDTGTDSIIGAGSDMAKVIDTKNKTYIIKYTSGQRSLIR